MIKLFDILCVYAGRMLACVGIFVLAVEGLSRLISWAGYRAGFIGLWIKFCNQQVDHDPRSFWANKLVWGKKED